MTNIARWKVFTKEQLEEILKSCNSISEFGFKIGYLSASSASRFGKAAIEFHQLSKEHLFDGRKNQFDYSRFSEGKSRSGWTLKYAIVNLRGNKCESCGLSLWLEKELSLQVHHIDGNSSNNLIENLQLLCPNCHSLTDSFCGKRNSGSQKKHSEEDLKNSLENNQSICSALRSLGMSTGRENYVRCREIIQKYSIEHLSPIKIEKETEEKRCSNCDIIIGKSKTGLCLKCYALTTRIVERPSREILKEEIRNNSFLSLGKKYDVSDNAVRKWCKLYKLPFQSREIKDINDKDWEFI